MQQRAIAPATAQPSARKWLSGSVLSTARVGARITGAAHGIGLATGPQPSTRWARRWRCLMSTRRRSLRRRQRSATAARSVSAPDVVDLDEVTGALQTIRVSVAQSGHPGEQRGLPRRMASLRRSRSPDWRRVVDVILVGAFNCSRSRAAGDACEKMGPHHQHLLAIAPRKPRPDELLGCEGRFDWVHACTGLGKRGVSASPSTPSRPASSRPMACANSITMKLLRDRSIAKSPLKRVGQPG